MLNSINYYLRNACFNFATITFTRHIPVWENAITNFALFFNRVGGVAVVGPCLLLVRFPSVCQIDKANPTYLPHP